MKRLYLSLCGVFLVTLLCFSAGCKKSEDEMKGTVKTEVITGGDSVVPTTEATEPPVEKKAATPEPTATAAPGNAAIATNIPEPTEVGKLTDAPEPTALPEGSKAPSPTIIIEPTPTLKPTPTPKPTSTPSITPAPTPEGIVFPIDEFIDAGDKKKTGGDEMDKEMAFFGRLSVNGTKLVDAKGNKVVLRGISTHGLGWFPTYVNESCFRQMKEEWGCNVVRLAMYTGEYNGYCSSNEAQKKNLKNIIDIGVEAATKLDLYVLIDWHILSDGNPATNEEEAKLFFEEVSKKYAGNPHVIYEICNEPNGNVNWNGVKKYAETIISIIRKNDKDAIIIVGTPTWSQDVDLAAANPITGYENIMYALHYYAGTHKQGLRDKCTKALAMGLPVFVTEYGICDASGNGALDYSEADRWVSYLNANDISFIAWNLSNKSESSAMIKSSCNKKNGFTKEDLSDSGLWFVKMMKTNNGGMGAEGLGSTDAGKVKEDNSKIKLTPTIAVANYQKLAEEYFEAGEGVSLTVTNAWDSGNKQSLQLNLTVTNSSEKKEIDWKRTIKIKKAVTMEIAQDWNGTMVLKGDTIEIAPVEYNSVIAPGATIGDIGMILEF